MAFLHRSGLAFSLSTIASLLIASCAPTKYDQCNAVITIANETVNQARDLTDRGQTSDRQAMLQAADAMEEAALEMEALSLNDPQLQDYQAGFVKMYRDTAQATRDFIKASENYDREAAKSAQKRLQQATAPEKELVTGINNYCNGS